MIICALFPHFAAQVAQHDDPVLADKPLIIGGYPWQRRKVYAASAQARQAGVAPGMALSRAWLLCPRAHFLPAEESRYQAAFESAIQTLYAFTHRLEPESAVQTSPAVYLDLGKLREEDLLGLADSIRAALSPYAVNIGIGASKFTARAAASGAGFLYITPAEERAFLAGLSLSRLRINNELARRLRMLGIYRLGDLAKLPRSSIMTQFGAEGLRLYDLALGYDERPVLPRQPDRVYTAARPFDPPLDNHQILENALGELAAELAGYLDAHAFACQRLALRLDGVEARHDLRQAVTTAPAIRRELLRLLDGLVLGRGVAEITVEMGGLIPALPQQLPLFPDLNQNTFDSLIANLRRRHSGVGVFRVRLSGETGLLPERAYQMEQTA